MVRARSATKSLSAGRSPPTKLERPDYGEALYQGLTHAAGPWAFIINVDFWDVPFMRWCFRTRGAYDMVMGSKRADDVLNQQDNYRRTLSWGLNTILQTVFNFPGTDTHGQKFVYLPALRPIFAQCVMRRGQFDTEFTLRAAAPSSGSRKFQFRSSSCGKRAISCCTRSAATSSI